MPAPTVSMSTGSCFSWARRSVANGLLSSPTEGSPKSLAANVVVPPPQKGSRTHCFGHVDAIARREETQAENRVIRAHGVQCCCESVHQLIAKSCSNSLNCSFRIDIG